MDLTNPFIYPPGLEMFDYEPSREAYMIALTNQIMINQLLLQQIAELQEKKESKMDENFKITKIYFPKNDFESEKIKIQYHPFDSENKNDDNIKLWFENKNINICYIKDTLQGFATIKLGRPTDDKFKIFLLNEFQSFEKQKSLKKKNQKMIKKPSEPGLVLSSIKDEYKVSIRNIPRNFSIYKEHDSEMLKEWFTQHGCYVITVELYYNNPEQKKHPRGFGFAYFHDKISYDIALTLNNKKIIDSDEYPELIIEPKQSTNKNYIG